MGGGTESVIRVGMLVTQVAWFAAGLPGSWKLPKMYSPRALSVSFSVRFRSERQARFSGEQCALKRAFCLHRGLSRWRREQQMTSAIRSRLQSRRRQRLGHGKSW